MRWKVQVLLEKQFFTCSLILSDEMSENQIDTVAINNNFQKRPRAARDPIDPREWHISIARQVFGLVQPGLKTYHKRRTESAEAEGAYRCKNQTVLRETLPHFEEKQRTTDCWPWSAPLVDVEMNWSGLPNLIYPLFDNETMYSDFATTIAVAHDRLCGP